MRRQSGITLIELLIGITISVVAGVLLIYVMVYSNNLFFVQTVKVNQGLSLNQSSSEITDLIKSSSGISNQYPPTGGAQYTTDANTLILKVPALNMSGGIMESVFDYAVIEADANKPTILRKKIFADNTSSRKAEDKVLTTTLNDFVLNYLDSNNNPINPIQAARVVFTINLYESSGDINNRSSISETVNIKNL